MVGSFKGVAKNHEVLLPSKQYKPGSEFIDRLEIWLHKGKRSFSTVLILFFFFFFFKCFILLEIIL